MTPNKQGQDDEIENIIKSIKENPKAMEQARKLFEDDDIWELNFEKWFKENIIKQEHERILEWIYKDYGRYEDEWVNVGDLKKFLEEKEDEN